MRPPATCDWYCLCSQALAFYETLAQGCYYLKPLSRSPSLPGSGSPSPTPPSLLIRGRSSVHTLSLLCLPPSLNSSHFLSPVYTSVTMIDRCSLLVNEHFPPHKLRFHVTRLAMPFKRSVDLKSSLQVFLPSAQNASSWRALFDFVLSLNLNCQFTTHPSAPWTLWGDY